MFKGFSRSVKGVSHERKGIVCQDASSHRVADRYAVCVVADGHGSKKHFRSNFGSQFAVEATLETIDRFYENADEFEENFPLRPKMVIKNIEKQIISIWNEKVNAHLKENPVTVEEKKKFSDKEFAEINPESYYGTTLIAGVAGKGFTFGIQIGDGSLVAIFEDGKAVLPMNYDESAPANVTSSMCNANASQMFNSFFIKDKKLLGMFASTDGLYTSFASEYDFLDYHVVVASQLVDTDRIEQVVVKNITKRSHFGTEDDISFSCVYDDEMANECNELIKKNIEENKRIAAERKAALLATKKNY
ncbi:MAG: protein phosphatase 2C domain-containing protein [Oscillospiraceae bacterium]|nr:protein phosphatase 2C domain-containing protein [Oscillospiraceae bacterium]MCR5805702.1 protein phosphatase 2C domain-containing protein [Oscillospiraceae bacterium]